MQLNVSISCQYQRTVATFVIHFLSHSDRSLKKISFQLTSKGIGEPTSEAIDGASLSVSAWLISSTSMSSPSFLGTFSSAATAASGCAGFVPRSCEVLLRRRSPGEGLRAEPLVEDLSFFFFFFVPDPDFFFWNIFSCK